jgi:hypothetical protein
VHTRFSNAWRRKPHQPELAIGLSSGRASCTARLWMALPPRPSNRPLQRKNPGGYQGLLQWRGRDSNPRPSGYEQGQRGMGGYCFGFVEPFSCGSVPAGSAQTAPRFAPRRGAHLVVLARHARDLEQSARELSVHRATASPRSARAGAPRVRRQLSPQGLVSLDVPRAADSPCVSMGACAQELRDRATDERLKRHPRGAGVRAGGDGVRCPRRRCGRSADRALR